MDMWGEKVCRRIKSRVAPRDRQHEKTCVNTSTAVDAISNLKVGSDAY